MNKIKQTIILGVTFVLIVGGLAVDTKLNIDTVHASYNATADTIFSVPGTSSQYLRGDRRRVLDDVRVHILVLLPSFFSCRICFKRLFDCDTLYS